MSSEGLKAKLNTLKAQRKEGKLSLREFYKELVTLAITLSNELLDEDIKKQVPLAFLEDQISKMEGRGH